MRVSLCSYVDFARTRNTELQYQRIEQTAIAADVAGFDTLWLIDPEHVIYPAQSLLLSWIRRLTSVTRQIRLAAVLRIQDVTVLHTCLNDIAGIHQLSENRVRLALDLPFAAPQRLTPASSSAQPAPLISQADNLGTSTLSHQLPTVTIVGRSAYSRTIGQLGLAMLVLDDNSESAERLIHSYRYGIGHQPANLLCRYYVQLQPHEEEYPTIHAPYHHGIPQHNYRVLEAPSPTVIGSAQQIVAQLLVEQLRLGFDEVVCQLDDPQDVEAISILGQYAVPYLQQPPAQ